MKLACLLALLCLLTLTGALAQTGTDGAVLGVVTDSSGGLVIGAQVTITNSDTGLVKTALTSSDGSFEIGALPRGYYSVSVTFARFKTWALPRSELTIGERKKLSPGLELGELNEEVTIEASGELLQTEKAEVGGLVEEATIRELPLNGRDVIELVELVPGMRYAGKSLEPANGPTSNVQGLGHRDDQAEFRVDGVASNAVCDEGSTGVPNPDTVAQFSVATSNFSAENGRNPIQVTVVTKSGTNEFHSTLWEFLRNNAFDARNTFAVSNPKLVRNQFGVAGGGPVIKNRTFFFGSYEGTRVIQSNIFNSPTVSPDMLQGDFSGLPTIRDPSSRQPFAGNQIPQSQFSGVSRFFFPWILQPNSPGNLYRNSVSIPNNIDEFNARVDHQITQAQRIYWRYYRFYNAQTMTGYRPDITAQQKDHQYSMGLNYDFTISPTTLLNLSIGAVQNRGRVTSKCCGIGKENLTEEAGIRGFQTAGREEWVGLPDTIAFDPYTSISSQVAWGTPDSYSSQSINGSASMNLVRGRHTIVAGYQYSHLYLLASNGSCCSRGVFQFNGQYTGDAFADYLLGYMDDSLRNYPLHTFGMKSNPYGALFIDDFWKISSQVTVELGLRWDYWFAKSLIRGAGGTFDPKLGKVIAGLNSKGEVDLTAQPVSPFLAQATAGLWIPASEVHVPGGLFEPNGYVSPRLGVAWRPLKTGGVVVRAGYGAFTSSYRGNITASQIIAPPYWTYEEQFWSAGQLQRWETAWPSNPKAFTAPSVGASAYNVKPMKDHEWNISIQKALPFRSAVTLSYVGSKANDLVTDNSLNNVPPGLYSDLQAAKPYPMFGGIDLYENTGRNHYHSGQLKMERRFSQGLSFMLSYAFSKNISEAGGDSIWATPTPFAPAGYNRGRAAYDHTHILATNAVWEIPVGHGHAAGASLNPLVQGFVGGWELSGIYLFSSGDPLTFGFPGATLGNGWNTRPNVIGNLRLSDPRASLWFNPSALAAPEPYLFGNAGIGILDGPSSQILNLALMKRFPFGEKRYVQFRWEAFNAFNHANLRDPNTTIGQSTTGQIFSAGAAREMQIALKVIF